MRFSQPWLALASLGMGALAAPRNDDPWSGNDWQKYIRSPDSDIVKPKKIISENTTGDVTNPDGLIDGSKITVLKRDSADSDAPSVLVDFGLNVVGLINIHFEGSESSGDARPGLRLAFSETLEGLTEKSDYTRSYRAIYDHDKLTNGTDQVAVKDKTYSWKNTWGCEHVGQVCSDGLHGFRYVSITLDALESDSPHTTSEGSVSIESVDLEWSAYLGTPDTFTGWFECSDEDITQWWFDGVYTTDTNTDYFFKNETEPRDAWSPTLDGKWVLHDGAKRDRDPYVGDLAIASLTSYLSHDFPEATFNVLEDLAVHQREDGYIPPASINNYTLPLFDYTLWWVVCTADLVMYTGDTKLTDEHWDVLKKALDEYYPKHFNEEIGLLDKKDSDYGDYAFLPRKGPITYYNALYIHALNYASQLAKHIGHEDDAERWSARASKIPEKLIARNFDTESGAFLDGGPCPDDDSGNICDVRAQDGNGIAILAGVTNDTLSKSILDYWAENTKQEYGNAFYDSSILSPDEKFDERVYALISFFELSARFLTPGTEASAFEEIRRLYGWMASHDPGVTQWEGIGPGGGSYQGPFMSYAHAWATGIVPLMSNYVLGVKPTAPGFKEWSICPVVKGDLEWAKGVIPTPDGSIKVSWEKKEDSSVEIKIVAPENTKGELCVPDIGSDINEVKLNGEGQDKNENRIKVKGGKHTLIVS